MPTSQTDWRSAMVDYIRNAALPPEKYSHQPRLYQLALQVAEGLQYDDDILFAAAWLHDLGVFIGHRPADPATLAAWDNVAYAIEQAPALLRRFGFPEARISPVIEAIRTHQPHADPQTTEALILRDADILEQLGAVGILRTVCKIGRDTRFVTFRDALDSLQRACEQLPGQLRLESARRLAVARVAILRDFLAAASAEAGSAPL